MVNSRASGGTMTVIEKYTAGSAEASKTFTFNAVDFDNDSYLLLVIDGSVTAALDIEMIINGLTADYYVAGMRHVGGAETLINPGALAHMVIASSTVLTAANKSFFTQVYISLNKSGTSDRPKFNIQTISDIPAMEFLAGLQASAVASITSVLITTSTSTWQSGTRMTLYKVKR